MRKPLREQRTDTGPRRRIAHPLVVAVLAAGSLFATTCGKTPHPWPNVLVVVLDTTRADRCGVMGYEKDTTPALDDLARKSTVFTQAWVPTGWIGLGLLAGGLFGALASALAIRRHLREV